MNNFLHVFWNKYKVHILVWAIFIMYETFVVGFFLDSFGTFGSYIVHYCLNIFIFYFHAHGLLRLFNQKKLNLIWILPIGIIVEVVLYITLLSLIDYLGTFYPQIFGDEAFILNKSFVLKSVWRALYFIGFSTGYYFLLTYLKEKEHIVKLERQRLKQIIKQQEIEQELARAQNAYLRAQINPHFLFNTLNFIYNRSRKTAPVAADAILTLSAMMRYAIEAGSERGDISIEDELEQVGHLVHLHKLRQNEQIYFNIHTNEQAKKIRLIPLVLITLVENVFKHGNLSLAHHPALLEIKIEEGFLHIHTDNLINAIHNASGFSKGLENIDRRLKHAYRDAALFRYETDARNHFKTYVSIKLNDLNPFLT